MTFSDDRVGQTQPTQSITRADYLEFSKEAVQYYVQDFP